MTTNPANPAAPAVPPTPVAPATGMTADAMIAAAYAQEEAQNPVAPQVADFMAGIIPAQPAAPAAPAAIPAPATPAQPAAPVIPAIGAPVAAQPVAPAAPAAPAPAAPAVPQTPEEQAFVTATAPLLTTLQAGTMPTDAEIGAVAAATKMPASVVKEWVNLKAFYNQSQQPAAPAAPAAPATSAIDSVTQTAKLHQDIGGAANWDAFATYMGQTADPATLDAYRNASAGDRVKIASVYVDGFKTAAVPPRRDVTANNNSPASSTAAPAVTQAQVQAMFADRKYVTDPAFRATAQAALLSLTTQQR